MRQKWFVLSSKRGDVAKPAVRLFCGGQNQGGRYTGRDGQPSHVPMRVRLSLWGLMLKRGRLEGGEAGEKINSSAYRTSTSSLEVAGDGFGVGRTRGMVCRNHLPRVGGKGSGGVTGTRKSKGLFSLTGVGRHRSSGRSVAGAFPQVEATVRRKARGSRSS